MTCEWIKCSDRLPEKDTWVLCYLHNSYPEPFIFSLKFYIYEWSDKRKISQMPMFKSLDRSWQLEDVSHWMPLPAQPESLITKEKKFFGMNAEIRQDGLCYFEDGTIIDPQSPKD